VQLSSLSDEFDVAKKEIRDTRVQLEEQRAQLASQVGREGELVLKPKP
jgi:hypothetical protein